MQGLPNMECQMFCSLGALQKRATGVILFLKFYLMSSTESRWGGKAVGPEARRLGIQSLLWGETEQRLGELRI